LREKRTMPLESDDRAILRRRAELLRVPPPTETAEEEVWLAAFSVGHEPHALLLSSLRAIVPLKLVTPVPLVPAHVLGVLRYEGEIVTALSLAALLGGRAWQSDSRFLLVVEPARGRMVALDCSEIPLAMMLPARVVAAGQVRDDGAIREVPAGDRRILRVIDVARLVRSK
jgi:chemotaxis signal transduction protein